MESQKQETGDPDEDDLDPRIQIELEKLNNATDEINKLEMELDEANSTFNMLMNDSMRRIKLWARKLGSCIERARPYYEALEIAKKAQQECQRAAVKYQRANEIHQAAKETVALAEARFLSKQHVWQFDNAWQDMLNHATLKVMEAENQKAESGREHQKRATLFHEAEQKVQMLEQKLKRSITKSRPYFEEKAVCQSQLDAQKQRVGEIQTAIAKAKAEYAASLRQLESISEEIHLRRKYKSGNTSPTGPREPGVGAELTSVIPIEKPRILNKPNHVIQDEAQGACCKGDKVSLDYDLDHYDLRSIGNSSKAPSSAVSEGEDEDDVEEDLEELKARANELTQRASNDDDHKNAVWEAELNATIHRLDNALYLREFEPDLRDCVKTNNK